MLSSGQDYVCISLSLSLSIYIYISVVFWPGLCLHLSLSLSIYIYIYIYLLSSGQDYVCISLSLSLYIYIYLLSSGQDYVCISLSLPLSLSLYIYIYIYIYIYTSVVFCPGLCLHLKIPEKFVSLTFQDGYWFMKISFGSMVKFQFLAQFPVSHLPHPVMSSLVLFFKLVCSIRLLCNQWFRLSHHTTNICYSVVTYEAH